MQFGFLLEQVVNGLVLGGYYLLIALGLSLIFSVGGIVNLAHGAFYALGAYISVEITKYLGFGPAVVLSPRSYNAKVGLCLVCPVTHHAKGYAFEVALPDGLPVQGVVLADHVKSADWQERGSDHIATVTTEVLDEVRAKLKPLLGM